MKIDFSRLHEVINTKFYGLLRNTSRYLALVGSGGSGKSHFLAQKFLQRTVEEDIGHRFLIIRKFQPALRRSAFTLIKDYIARWGLWKILR